MRKFKIDLILLLVTVIYSSTFSIVKDVLNETTPYYFIVYRFILATVLFYFVFRKSLILDKITVKLGIILGLIYGIGFCFQTVGLQYTTSSKSAFITGMLVVFAPIFQIIIEKKWIKIWQILGVVFAGSGLYILSSPEGGSINMGDLLTLISAVLFGLYVVFVSIFSRKADLKGLVFVQMGIALLFTLPFALAFEPFKMNLSAKSFSIITYTAIFPTIICNYLTTKYQKYSTPTRASIIYSFEPFFAALIALTFYNELIGSNIIFGGILIFLGLLSSEFSDYLSNLLTKKVVNR